MDIRAQIGSRIRQLRQLKSMSIEELAFKSGVHYNYLGDIERGARNPSIESLVKISRGLGAEIGDIFKTVSGVKTGKMPLHGIKRDDAYRLSRSIVTLLKDKSPDGRRFIVAMVKKLSAKIK